MAGNDDFEQGQGASDSESVAVPRDDSDSDVAPPKLPPAVRKLADTLSPGALDGAPSPVGQDLDAPRQRRSCAPLPKTPRPPKRARAASKAGDAPPAAPPAAAPPPAAPPVVHDLTLDSDSDDGAPATADDGDDSDRDSAPAPAPQPQPPFPVGCVVADIDAPQHALEVVSVEGDKYTLKYLENAGAWQGHEIIRSEESLIVYGAALPPRSGRVAPPAPPPKRALKAATPDVEPPRATPSPTPTPPPDRRRDRYGGGYVYDPYGPFGGGPDAAPEPAAAAAPAPTPPARAAPTPSRKRRAPLDGASDSDDGKAPPKRARPSTSGDAAFAAALAKSLANEDAAPSPTSTKGDAAYAAALAAPPAPPGDEAFARALAGVDEAAAPAPTRAHDDAAVPEESTANDAALAAAFADGSSDDENAAPSAPAKIPKCLQDKNTSGVCDPFAAPKLVDMTRPPPRRTCTQQPAPAVRPRNLAPLPPPLPPSPPRRGADAAFPFVFGQKIMAQHDGGPRFFRGTITAVHHDPPGTFGVAYDDDDYEEFVAGSLIKRALPSFDVDFGKNGKHRGTVIEEDGDGVTIEWRPVHLKRGEKETPEVEERSLRDLEKYLAAFRTGGRVHDVGPSAGLFVELFAGRGGLSRAMRGLNWSTVTLDDGSWPGAAVPTVRGDIRELHLSELSAVDSVRAVHASLPCKTWSCQAVDRHRPGRELDGPRISAEARDANDVVRHVIGELRYLKASCPDAIITVENPATGELKNYKPWKAACRELGLEAVDVTYCKFGAPHRKPTTIWTNCKGLIDAAAPGLWFCGGDYKCRNWRNHVRVEGADASESSEFPEAFCTWMGAHINTEADRRAALRDN